MEMTPWSTMSPHQLLDAAQWHLRDSHGEPEFGKALLAAAQVQATLSLEWTIENRIAPTISSAIWEGMGRR